MLNRVSGLFLQNQAALKAISLILIWVVICSSCLVIKKGSLQWDIQNYSRFLRQNLIKTGEKYSTEYKLCDFIVDTDRGSTLIQNLIDPEAVSQVKEQLGINGLEYYDKLSIIFDYVKHNYDFILDPHDWPTVNETLKTKQGDCNSLSLLMMSLLLSAGINVRAAISNGHMWVSALYDNEWHILEVDRDPERKRIYSLPGFYQNPVYLIFKDHSEKRKMSGSFRPFRNS